MCLPGTKSLWCNAVTGKVSFVQAQQVLAYRFTEPGSVICRQFLCMCFNIGVGIFLAHIVSDNMTNDLPDHCAMEQAEWIRFAKYLLYGCVLFYRTLIGPDKCLL